MEVMFYLVFDDNFPSSIRRGGEGQTGEKHEQKLRGWPAGQENVQVDVLPRHVHYRGKNKRALKALCRISLLLLLCLKYHGDNINETSCCSVHSIYNVSKR